MVSVSTGTKRFVRDKSKYIISLENKLRDETFGIHSNMKVLEERIEVQFMMVNND